MRIRGFGLENNLVASHLDKRHGGVKNVSDTGGEMGNSGTYGDIVVSAPASGPRAPSREADHADRIQLTPRR